MEAIRTLPEGLPEHSVGYDVVSWCERWLTIPDGPHAGEPWRFTREQGRFVLWYYAVDSAGRWLYQRATLRRAKGWGKNPLAAVMVLAEMMGPVRFAGWFDGKLMTKPQVAANISLAAVSFDQTRNTTDLFDGLLPQRTRDRYEMDLQREVWRARVDGKWATVRPTSRSAKSQEGARLTFMIADETHHWLEGNGGHALWGVIRRNLAKLGVRPVSMTNAHSPGENSIAEQDYETIQKAEREGRPLPVLYDSLEPKLTADWSPDRDEDVLAAMRVAYGDSDWAGGGQGFSGLPNQLDAYRDPTVTMGDGDRFYLNLLVPGGGKWLSPTEWDEALLEGFEPEPGTAIALGFDGAKSFDATALIATEMETGIQWPVGIWEQDYLDPDWEVPVDYVCDVVERTFSEYRVSRMYADPPWWSDELASWQGKWGPVVLPFQTGQTNMTRFARVLHSYKAGILDGSVRHGGPQGEVFRRHMLNAVARPIGGRAGEDGDLVGIWKSKKFSRDKIDAAVAGALSHQARLDAIASGWKAPVRVKSWALR